MTKSSDACARPSVAVCRLMRQWQALAAMGLVAMSYGCGGSDRASADVTLAGDPDLGQSIVAAVEEHGVPALAMATVVGGETRVAVAGTVSHDDEEPVGADAPFHLGSNGKAMTAALLATFVDEGRLTLDAALGELLPGIEMDPRGRDATLRQLLDHQAGLDDQHLDLRALHAADDVRAARLDVARDALSAPGGVHGSFSYSNSSYVVAGAIAEQLGGAPWEDLLTDRVFRPLGITCGFGAPRGPAVPFGHAAAGEPIPDDAPVTDNPPALRPAGGVHCSMRDWATFASSMLASARGEDTAVMSGAAATALFSGGTGDYVAGWRQLNRSGERLWAHDGSNTLWYARIILLVDRGEAVLIATNTGERRGVEAIDALTAEALATARSRHG